MRRQFSLIHGPSQRWRTVALIFFTGVAMLVGALVVLLVRGRDVEADEQPRRAPATLAPPSGASPAAGPFQNGQ